MFREILAAATIACPLTAGAMMDPPEIWIGQGGELYSGGSSIRNGAPRTRRIEDKHHRIWDCWDRAEDVPRGRYKSVSYRVTYVGGKRRGYYCGTNDRKRKSP